jgi:peptidoglycan/LPS O-acetylase OafA/YrhL
MVLILVLGSDPVRRQVGEVYFGRTLALVAVALVIVAAALLLKFVAWWLKTWRSERLRPALWRRLGLRQPPRRARVRGSGARCPRRPARHAAL